MRSSPIIIVGAGVIGSSLAAHLAKRGERPLVLERAHICAGTTGQSGGVVRQHYSNPEIAAMAKDALKIFRHWSDHFEGSSGFVPVGVMLTAGPESESGVRANVMVHQRLGIETSVISPEEAGRIEPRLSLSDCSAVCYEPGAGVADTIETNHAFAETARSMGVEFREGVTVDAITSSGGRITGVRTSEGDLAADIVINAAGAWGVALMSALGHDLPITFSRHPMALVRRPPNARHLHPDVLDVHTDAYFIPKGDETLIGKLGTMETDLGMDPESYDRGVTNLELDRFRRSGLHRLPFLDRGTVLGGWAGLYDDSIDAHPIIDAVPGTDGLFCALGMSGNCFKLSPVIGDLLATRIIDGPAATSTLDQFRFARFAEGQAHERAFTAMSVLA